jgi:hypothetical protein
MLWRLALASSLLLALLSAGCAYQPGALLTAPADPFTTVARTLDCLDLSVTLAADEHLPASSALVDYRFGNRCKAPVTIDLAAAVVTGYAADGTATVLKLKDGQHQVHAGDLDGEHDGSEALRYEAPKGTADNVRVCVELGRVAARKSANAAPQRVCLTAPGDDSAVDVHKPGFARAHTACEGHCAGPQMWSPPFGATWDVDGLVRLRMEMRVSGHVMDPAGVTMAGGEMHDVPVGGLGRLGAATFDLRYSAFVAGPIYVGGEIDLGGGPSSASVLRSSPRAVSTGGTVVQAPMGGMVGVSFGRLGIFEPSAEVFVGGRLLALDADRGDASAPSTTQTRTSRLIGWRTMIAPRGAIDFWLGPHLTMGVWGGVDALHATDLSGGISVAVHLRSYDAH